jgi:hypothetical protein
MNAGKGYIIRAPQIRLWSDPTLEGSLSNTGDL